MARNTEATTIIDRAVGIRVREHRIAMGLSRMQLAKEIGVTHQQLGKYETGDNRMSASRLVQVANAFNKPVGWLFENIENAHPLPAFHQRMCIEVSRNFLLIKDPMHQNAINLLVRTLSAGAA